MVKGRQKQSLKCYIKVVKGHLVSCIESLRDLVNVVENRLLEPVCQGAEGFDGVLDSLSDLFVLQGLVIGHIVGEFPGGGDVLQ